jgi:hypothetical protein
VGYAFTATFGEKIGRNRPDFAAHRRLGGVRRKPGADRRRLAYFGPGAFLSSDGARMDFAVETAREVDGNGFLSGRFALKQLY